MILIVSSILFPVGLKISVLSYLICSSALYTWVVMSDTGVRDFALLPAHRLSTVECHICLAVTLVNILGDAPDISFKFCLVSK